MQLYALCLDALLHALEEIMTKNRIERRSSTTAVIAYADDVTLFVSNPQDISKIQEIIRKYETASGARINYRKSKALAIGTWDTTADIMNIPYVTDVKILGIHFTATTQQTVNKNWALTTSRIRGLAQAAYYRELNLAKRILYVHTYILATAWLTAQLLPIPNNCIPQINMAIKWYI
jgi:hypothetical protein